MSDMDDDELEATRQFYGVGRKKKIEVGPGGPMDEMPNDDLDGRTISLLDRINGKEVKKKWKLIKLGLKKK